MGNRFAGGEFTMVFTDFPIEEQGEAINRAQRRLPDRCMDLIQTAEMFVAQGNEAGVQPLERFAMCGADQKIVRQNG